MWYFCGFFTPAVAASLKLTFQDSLSSVYKDLDKVLLILNGH